MKSKDNNHFLSSVKHDSTTFSRGWKLDKLKYKSCVIKYLEKVQNFSEIVRFKISSIFHINCLYLIFTGFLFL